MFSALQIGILQKWHFTISEKVAIIRKLFGGVAQLGERTVRIRKVESSILFVSTKKSVKSMISRIFCNFSKEVQDLRTRHYPQFCKISPRPVRIREAEDPVSIESIIHLQLLNRTEEYSQQYRMEMRQEPEMQM